MRFAVRVHLFLLVCARQDIGNLIGIASIIEGRPTSYVNVAQLGEHPPKKQGSRSSNLPSPFAEVNLKGKKLYAETLEETEVYHTYLENRILNKNELNIQIRISRHLEAIQSDCMKKTNL